MPTYWMPGMPGRWLVTVLAFDGAVAGLEQAGGDRRVVPHGNLPAEVLREALVVAIAGGISLACVPNEIDVELERSSKCRLIHHRSTNRAIRDGGTPRSAKRVQNGRECCTEVAPTRLPAHADSCHARPVDLAGDRGYLFPGWVGRHLDSCFAQHILPVHQKRRFAIE